MTDFSSNLTVINFGRRASDGKVLIRFKISEPGIYYVIRYCCRAYAPGDTTGIVMTPDLADLEHAQDPLIVTTENEIFTWVWDAVADGYSSVDLSGWAVYLGYYNLFCCTHPRQPTAVEEPLTTTTATTPATTTSSTPPTSPTSQPTPASPTPPAAPQPTTSTPAPTSSKTTSSWGFLSSKISTTKSTSASKTSHTSVKTTSTAPTTKTTASNVPSTSGPTSPASTPVTSTFFGQNSGTTNPQNPSGSSPASTPTNGFVPGSKAPISWYGLESDNPLYYIETFLVPGDKAPKNSMPLLMVVFRLKAGGCTGWKFYVEGRDSAGNRYCLEPGAAFDDIDPSATNKVRSKVFCLNLKQFKTGIAKILATVVRTDNTAGIGKVRELEVTSEDFLPEVARSSGLTPNVISLAGLTGTIAPKFAGSYHSTIAADYYVIEATINTGVVVKATSEALVSGFSPLLKIFDPGDLVTPVVSTSSRFSGLSDSDKACLDIGWRDSSGVLTPGQPYLIQIVHTAIEASSAWGFQIYTNGTVDAPTATFSIDGNGKLLGSITSPYGLQALKLVNERTGDAIFVLTDSQGSANIQDDASPAGDKLDVSLGDYIRIYRPGIGLLYRSEDLILRKIAPSTMVF